MAQHAAFFGLGALVARAVWIGATPLVLGMLAGAAVATACALLIGVAAFRLRGAYFAIGMLALGEISRTTISNLLPEISTLPTTAIGAYRLSHRYCLALGLAAVAVAAVAALATSRTGLGMQAVREDEEAAEASGVSALSVKLTALYVERAAEGAVPPQMGLFQQPVRARPPCWRGRRCARPRPPCGRPP